MVVIESIKAKEHKIKWQSEDVSRETWLFARCSGANIAIVGLMALVRLLRFIHERTSYAYNSVTCGFVTYHIMGVKKR
jgi:hypothetical protein